jgi:hypothetical protein
MDQPTPEKQDGSANWPMVLFLCICVVSAAAVCIVGMLLFF